MATGNRTLKLSILADVDDLKKKLNDANGDVEKSASGLEKFGKAATVAFAAAVAAAGAYATKIAVDGVKAAIEDQQAQLRLASALESATGATQAQIKATEDYILKAQLATGVADNELRAAFQRLSVSTGSITKSQQLLNLALDVSKGTGKDLNDVVEALSKAYEGQDTRLARLGIGLSAADLKQMDFTQTTQRLTELYGGAASRNAETFQGRIDRLGQSFNEAKETIGYALLPIIERLVDFVVNSVLPNLSKFASFFDPIKEAIIRNKDSFETLINFLKDTVIPILVNGLGDALQIIAKVAGFVLDVIAKVIDGINSAVNVARSAINNLISAYNAIPLLPNIATAGGSVASTSARVAAASSAVSQGYSAYGTGGAFTEIAPRTSSTTIIVNGAIDPEGTARSVSKVINNSSNRVGSLLSGTSVRGD